ncbi:MAG: hypothetical protein A3K41_14255 [Chloroflexi bacterium RIFOXYD12_FULL_57_15]|nr:MAG: hypothetical protein A3K41_14255 [Chloroflexi bacterium RIFOXYD12_FULL_57_15]
MHKLIIIFGQPLDSLAFVTGWQAFLHMAEQMPGLRRETVSLIDGVIYGENKPRPFKIHELYFDDRAALDAALASDAGQQAGEWLHQFTGGKFTLLTAPHQEATAKDFKKKPGRARSA